MSRVSRRSTTDHERIKRQKRQNTTTSTESPCGRKPAPIDAGDISLTFIENDSQKFGKYRLRVTFPEVTEDIDGFPASTIDRYIVHLQHSNDGSTWDSDFRRKVVDAKDGDSNSTGKAIFKNITRKRYYRVRVRAKDSGGCKSDLSDWSSPQRAGGSDTVPSVGTINKSRVGPRRIEFDWDDVEHPDFDRYKVVILRADTENGGYDIVRTRYTRQSFIAVHVADTDKTKWWKVRVRVQLVKNPDGSRDEGTDQDSGADQADDIGSGGSSGGGGGGVPALPNPSATLDVDATRMLLTWTVADNSEALNYRYRIKYSTTAAVTRDGSYVMSGSLLDSGNVSVVDGQTQYRVSVALPSSLLGVSELYGGADVRAYNGSNFGNYSNFATNQIGLPANGTIYKVRRTIDTYSKPHYKIWYYKSTDDSGGTGSAQINYYELEIKNKADGTGPPSSTATATRSATQNATGAADYYKEPVGAVNEIVNAQTTWVRLRAVNNAGRASAWGPWREKGYGV